MPQNVAVKSERVPNESFDSQIDGYRKQTFSEGRKIFREETFGSEAFFGGTLQLQRAILSAKQGGIGDGLTPMAALELGLKVDVAKVPNTVVEVLKHGHISLEDPKTTIELLKADAVIGVKGFFDKQGHLTSVGVQCALCHSTVDDSFMRGIGRRLDGWPNRDLDVGQIVALSAGLGTYMYRTTPLRGLFVRAKGGFYHDGRFPDLPSVVRHYEHALRLELIDAERGDLVEYLKSL